MPNRSAEHSLTLTVDEAAALIGVSRSTAYDLVATDELPTVRLRRRILVPASALADLLGVSPVEVYGALNRLRGRTGPTPSRLAGGRAHTSARWRHPGLVARLLGPTLKRRLRRTPALVTGRLLPSGIPRTARLGTSPILRTHLCRFPTGTCGPACSHPAFPPRAATVSHPPIIMRASARRSTG